MDCTGLLFILVCRISHFTQKSLWNQEKKLREIVKQRGGKVIDALTYIGSTYRGEWEDLLEAAGHKAREHNAILLALETDRFMRHPLYHPDDQREWTNLELQWLAHLTSGAPLMTVEHPNKSGRSEQTKRGIDQKKNGKVIANELRREGYSLGSIADRFGRKKETVQKWLKDKHDDDHSSGPNGSESSLEE
jgi:hypothetical protein